MVIEILNYFLYIICTQPADAFLEFVGRNVGYRTWLALSNFYGWGGGIVRYLMGPVVLILFLHAINSCLELFGFRGSPKRADNRTDE